MILKNKNRAIIALVTSALLFGSTFAVVKDLISDLTPVNIVFLRYLLATLLFLITGGVPEKKYIKPGLLMGLFLWIGYITQTIGLETTSTINSGVVTGFYIVLTPIFSKYINKNSIHKKNLIGSIAGFSGILLIALNDLDQLFGNLFTLICATGYALHIVMVEKYVKDLNISKLMFVQSGVGSILCIPFLNYENLNISFKFLLPIFFLGIVVNFCAFYLQLYGQKFINASTASLLFGLEGVFALLIGVFFVGEILNLLNWVGVVLILIAIFYVIKE
ncbi:MAG: DMT family transporter [Candidatus Actinomarina sp.]|tara:strand:- start:444 stop:1271 length:828 start_codon:yes stop_codon:yes gene_type:complete